MSDRDRSRPRLDANDKSQPEKHNGFLALTRFALILFLLVAGGFFA